LPTRFSPRHRSGHLPIALAGFSNLRALSRRNDAPEKASRPFDAERDGFVIGEGAGIVFVEELEHAKRRGANILAEIVGIGATGDAYHQTSPAPDGEGAVRACRMALDDAGIKPEAVDYINAHGTKHELNDASETAAIKKVFGAHAYKLAVSSTKSMVGHLLGAAAGVEAIFCVLAIQDDIIPPTINQEHPDPPAISTTCRTWPASSVSTWRSRTRSGSAATMLP